MENEPSARDVLKKMWADSRTEVCLGGVTVVLGAVLLVLAFVTAGKSGTAGSLSSLAALSVGIVGSALGISTIQRRYSDAYLRLIEPAPV